MPPDPIHLHLLRPDMPSPADLHPWLEKISENRWFTNFGPLGRALEAELGATFPQAVHVSTISSGTAGLELALQALELPPGAEVLMPSFTFPATATAVIRAGLTPVFSDVELDSWTLSPTIARACFEIRQSIAAVVPVAVFGRPLGTDAWDRFTRDTGSPVLIDAAGAFGNQEIGELTAAVFSMHATKAFAAGEGGFVASCDPEFIARIRDASNFGFKDQSDIIWRPGTNAKLSEYHAAVGLASLERWLTQAARRRDLIAAYEKLFAGRATFQQGEPKHWVRSMFNLRLHGMQPDDSFISALAARGIESRRWYWPPLHEHPAFSEFARIDELPVTRSLSHDLIGLPFHLDLTPADIARVAAAVGEVLGQ